MFFFSFFFSKVHPCDDALNALLASGIILDKRKLANLAMGCSSALGTVILLLVKLGASYETEGSA